jgi:hypothetical protein
MTKKKLLKRKNSMDYSKSSCKTNKSKLCQIRKINP